MVMLGYNQEKLDYSQVKLEMLNPDWLEHMLGLMVNSLGISLHEQVMEYTETWQENLESLAVDSRLENIQGTTRLHHFALNLEGFFFGHKGSRMR